MNLIKQFSPDLGDNAISIESEFGKGTTIAFIVPFILESFWDASTIVLNEGTNLILKQEINPKFISLVNLE